MHVPAVVFAVDPDHGRVVRARDEVIALRLVAVPPSRLDALGTGEELEFLFADAPRRLEQPERPRPRLPELARIPFPKLDAAPGVFGTMVGLRRQPMDRPSAEPPLQPLCELRPVFLVGARIAEHSRR